MSAKLPAVSRKAAKVRAYASTTHCRSEKLECKAVWMSGNATLTIVMSSKSMNVPRQTATSVHHLSSAAPTVDGSVLAGRSPTAGAGSTRSVIVGPRPSTAP